MNAMIPQTAAVGIGCTSVADNATQHNPRPSSARGLRRHAARQGMNKVNAMCVWGTPPKRTYKAKRNG